MEEIAEKIKTPGKWTVGSLVVLMSASQGFDKIMGSDHATEDEVRIAVEKSETAAKAEREALEKRIRKLTAAMKVVAQ
jgi:hypothetical protein